MRQPAALLDKTAAGAEQRNDYLLVRLDSCIQVNGVNRSELRSPGIMHLRQRILFSLVARPVLL